MIPYLRELVKGGHELTLLTFEPGEVDESVVRAGLREDGIDWHWLRYHKRFSVLATAWDIFRGTIFIRKFIRRTRPAILHGRVHVPTLMGALARKFSRRKPKLLFDIRGFFPEEYTDAGVWPEGGILYRSAKRVERWLMKESDGFVVLTENARGLLFPESKKAGFDRFGRPVEVIPCCVDFQRRFAGEAAEMRSRMRKELGVDGRRVLTHIGSLGGLYMTEQIADLLAQARAEDERAFALFLTQSKPEQIVPLLEERGFRETDYFVGRTAPAHIQEFLSASDVAISFVKSGYATASRSPTKIPEYLACGLPIISNRGVGDVDAQLGENGVGVLLDSLDQAGYSKGLKAVEALNGIADKCRETALREFDLADVGGARYRRVYDRLLARSR